MACEWMFQITLIRGRQLRPLFYQNEGDAEYVVPLHTLDAAHVVKVEDVAMGSFVNDGW